jgi:hypothetical protein
LLPFFFPLKDSRSQDHSLATLLDSCAQEKCAEMLFDGARADAQFRRDFFIAAALNQQVENLPVAARDFDLIYIQHFFASSHCRNAGALTQSTSFAKTSPAVIIDQLAANAALKDSDRRVRGVRNFCSGPLRE